EGRGLDGVGQRNSARAISGGCRMNRERLRNRRLCETFTLELGGLRYVASFSRYDDGRLAEVFLQNHKSASQSDSNDRDPAIAASLALQYGCPLDFLRRSLLRDASGSASTPLDRALDLIAASGERPRGDRT